MIETLLKAIRTLKARKQAAALAQEQQAATHHTALLSSSRRSYGAATSSRAPEESKQDELSALTKVLSTDADYIAKMAAICLFVQQIQHTRDTCSYYLLLIMSDEETLALPTRYRPTNWPGYLQSLWFTRIQDSIIANTEATQLKGHPREMELRSDIDLPLAEQTCLVSCRYGPHAHFKIEEHVFDCG